MARGWPSDKICRITKIKEITCPIFTIITTSDDRTEGGIGLHATAGSIRLVKLGDKDRTLEAKHHNEMAKLYDDPMFPTTLVTPTEIAALHPLVNTENLELGLRTIQDGDVDPTLLTNALAAEAKKAGATISLNTKVINIQVNQGSEKKFQVFAQVENGAENIILEADNVVNACGLWSQRISAMLGIEQSHPAFVIEHHYAVTEPIPLLTEMRARGERVPVLRDLAGSCYLRQEQDGILVGPYEALPLSAIHDEWQRSGPPETWAWELFPDALDRLDQVLMHAMDETMPALQEVGFASVVNGPTIWAPDSLPRCGRTQIPGYYDFNTLTYGIAHSLPLAEYLSGLMLSGEQSIDLTNECDPLRFGPWATDAFTKAKVQETYSMNNAPSYAYENRKAGREFAHGKNTALAQVLKTKGALTSFSQGVETALVYLDKNTEMNEAKFYQHDWAKIAIKEAEAVRSGVGLAAATGFSKFLITGPRARDLLLATTTNVVPKTAGACRLTYAIAPKSGSVVAEFTVSNLTGGALFSHQIFDKDPIFYVVGARDYAGHDAEWLRSRARALAICDQVSIIDKSEDIDILLLAGPQAEATLMSVVDKPNIISELNFLKFSLTPITVAGISGVTVARVSFTGEAGFELHLPASHSAHLFEALSKLPSVQLFGSHATNSLRLEKGFKVKGDLDYARFDEAGINPFIRKSWIPPTIMSEPTKKAALFQISMPNGFEWSVPSDCPVLNAHNEIIGYTTTSAYGTEAQATLAAGYLYTQKNWQHDLRLECFGEMCNLKVLDLPPAPVRGVLSKKKIQTPAVSLAGMSPTRRISQSVRSFSTSIHFDPTLPQESSPWLHEDYFRDTIRPVFEEASCFGAPMYTSPEIFKDERNEIFRKEWVCVGHVSDVAKPGDVLPFEICGHPLFAANHKGTIKAYHNVCRHRGARLVDRKQSGRAVVTCPYHRWGYALDGRLVGTPCWDDEVGGEGFETKKGDKQLPPNIRAKFDMSNILKFDKKDYGLFDCELDTWGGMLFARLTPGNVSLADHIGDLDIQFRHYPLDETYVARRSTLDNIQANWKILLENFSEYYHLPAVHPELCTVSGVAEHYRTQGSGKYLGFATAPLSNGGTFVDPDVAPPLPGIENTRNALAARHILIYPNVFMSFYPHHIMRCIVEPIDANTSREHFHVLAHPTLHERLGHEKAEELLDNFFAFHTKVNSEDMGICEAVQRGMHAQPYLGGRLSFRFEETIHRYQNMVVDSLVNKHNNVPPADTDFNAFDDLS
eukprot:CAMPEP_0197317982 /NCGR_PEP_ID=MMETSP0891-20130614/49209_1 /TAXON_ID=44058 ORGANISM="Aureoumbra lagunensis, Strain CCMP1510" /NCGR_SAMPLE_ID=MMETSP0891 /ASSEMBLY_ACC=CAM_ASM_000534 /LENGTH=1265 /DNA_ID=CAMNT_0042808215 /DNA_START=89 /DNA_END=3887 /DNA_ORIENTATION=-